MMDILARIERRINAGGPLELEDAEVDALSDEDIADLQKRHGARVLLRMPPRERRFFDWLHEEDPDVWKDLWGDDEEMLVALSFLADFRDGGRGFTICELESVPNYFFTAEHIRKPAVEMLGEILDRAERGEELAIGEGLLFEMLNGPIDIWHFAYRYGIPLARAKAAAEELAEHGWIVHLT
ncbi:MAG: hypothetical protein QHI48_07970, partial [Bacteroidota bacterium]|nr:hypothetical protein [Bacteroidota bacterium]